MTAESTKESKALARVGKQSIKLLVTLGLIVWGLFVFPQQIWMFSGVLVGVAGFQKCLGIAQPTFPLLAVPVFICIKWPEPTLSLVLFTITALVLGVWNWFGYFEKRQRWFWFGYWLLLLVWASWCWQFKIGIQAVAKLSNPSGPVVCLGDSLTDYGYPEVLQQKISLSVADFGFSGYSTSDAMRHTEEICALNPSVVVMAIGGHDHNTGKSRQSAWRNLQAMIEAFQSVGAEVIIIEIARGFVNDPWYGFERQLARRNDLHFIPDTMMRKLVFWGPIIPPGSWVSADSQLSEDGLHPTALGNEMIANTVVEKLEEVFGDKKLK